MQSIINAYELRPHPLSFFTWFGFWQEKKYSGLNGDCLHHNLPSQIRALTNPRQVEERGGRGGKGGKGGKGKGTMSLNSLMWENRIIQFPTSSRVSD